MSNPAPHGRDRGYVMILDIAIWLWLDWLHAWGWR